jgi:hypothetical protein
MFTIYCSFAIQSLCIPPLIGIIMTYPLFHQIPEDLQGKADVQPDFYDTDGPPVYENPEGRLIGQTISKHDVAALKLYQGSPETNIFWKFTRIRPGIPCSLLKEVVASMRFTFC